MKPSVLLEDVTFDFDESEDSLGPHIALTFDFQGGAASGYNKPLLFKADNVEINEEMVLKLKELGVDTAKLEKALYSSDSFKLIQAAIDEKNYVDWWDITWLVDFNDTTAIFLTDEGMYSADYTINGTTVTLSDVATPVVSLSNYVETDGDVLVSDSVRDTVEAEVLALLIKAESREDVKLKVSEILNKQKQQKEKDSVIKSEEIESEETKTSEVIIKTNEDPQLDINEILKSEEAKELLKGLVADAVQAEKAEKEELRKSLTDAQTRLEAVEKAEKERVEKSYTAIVKGFGFVEEDKVGDLVKALMNDPENSLIFVEALNKAHAEIEKVKAEFAEEKGVTGKLDIKKDANSRIAEIAEMFSGKK